MDLTGKGTTRRLHVEVMSKVYKGEAPIQLT